MRTSPSRLAGAALATGLLAACGSSSSPSDCGTESGTGCAPASARVDLEPPTFSNPTQVDNPLFPVSGQHSVVLLGESDGAALHVEVTLLVSTTTIVVDGTPVEVLVSQYVAFLDGRIHEVAIDWYAQADDGSVWYLGEDVFNYEDGVVADTDGTWQAGRDGPAAMIMPADPQVGNAYRPENIPGLVFEEVVVQSVGVTVDGPSGPVAGAIVVDELHMDDTHEAKTFAPGYGEFSTGTAPNLEAVALLVPTDAVAAPPPAELDAIQVGAADAFDAAGSEDWAAVSAASDDVASAWTALQAQALPPLLETQLGTAVAELDSAAGLQDSVAIQHAALDVTRASLDLRLRHRPVVEIDFARLDLHANRLIVDAGDGDAGGVKGDAATIERVRDRVVHTLASADAASLDAAVADIRAAADAEDFAAAATAGAALREFLAGL